MKLLVATANRVIIGGVETYLTALLPLLQKKGYTVGLVTAGAPIPGQPAIGDACPGIPSWIASSPSEVLAATRAWAPDVVYSHRLPDPQADAALMDAYPAIAYLHDYGASCISGRKSFAFPDWKPCHRRLGPGCLGFYFPRRCGGLNPVTALKFYGTALERQRRLPRYRSVLVASRHMAAEAVRHGVSPEKCSVNPYFPPDLVPDSSPPVARPPSGRIIFIGRITAAKGWHLLPRVISQASRLLDRPLKLVVAGDGPDRAAFEAEAERCGIASEFLGWIGARERLEQMRAADLLAVPSVWPEPFGMVGIEAGCVGLPSVAFPFGGIPDWLVPGVSGELAGGERPEPGEFATAVARAIANESHWQSLRVGAWRKAQEFTAEAHLERLALAFQSAR